MAGLRVPLSYPHQYAELRARVDATLAERLAAIDSDEYRGSDCYRLGAHVVRESVLWLGIASLIAVTTVVLWI